MSRRTGTRLRSLLGLAERDAQEAQRAFAEADAAVTEAEAHLNEAGRRLSELEPDATTPTTSPIGLLLTRQRAALRAADERHAMERLRELLEDQLTLRAELLSALRQRRSLENLAERHQATQAATAALAAQKALDETASLRRQRRQR